MAWIKNIWFGILVEEYLNFYDERVRMFFENSFTSSEKK